MRSKDLVQFNGKTVTARLRSGKTVTGKLHFDEGSKSVSIILEEGRMIILPQEIVEILILD